MELLDKNMIHFFVKVLSTTPTNVGGETDKNTKSKALNMRKMKQGMDIWRVYVKVVT